MWKLARSRRAPTPATPTVWLVGPWNEGEFAVARREIDRELAWPLHTSLAIACGALASSGVESPEVVLLAQLRPGVEDQPLVDRLQALAPLARVVVVAGSWCEGELRSGRPLQGVARRYWHEVGPWWRRSMARRRAGWTPAWSAAANELPYDGREKAPPGTMGVVAIDAFDFAVFEALAEALGFYGWSCEWVARGRGALPAATAGIFDCGQLDAAEQAALGDFCRGFAGGRAPVVALVDYPRAEHIEIADRVGAAAILGKPYSLAALDEALRQCADDCR